MSPQKMDHILDTGAKQRSVLGRGHKPSTRRRMGAGAAYQRALHGPDQTLQPEDVRELQQATGNQAVHQLLANRIPPPGGEIDPRLGSLIRQARTGGNPLDARLAAQMSRSLGSDLHGVRVHTDARASLLAQSLGAAAFTTGRDIFFRQGRFDPHSPQGRKVLAHELTHVVQQGGRQAGYRLKLGAENDLHEQQAERAGRNIAQGAHLPVSNSVSSASIQRVKDPEYFANAHDVIDYRKLGEHSLNPVFETNNREPIADSGKTKGYFKPNNPAEATPQTRRSGQEGAGVTSGSTMAARSVASYRLAKALGLGHIHSAESFGQLVDNTGKAYQGAVSAEVPGVQVVQRPSKDVDAPVEHDFTHPATQRTLSDLQLFDAVSGQADRHGGNIKIDPETHHAKGYDNDRAFGMGHAEQISQREKSKQRAAMMKGYDKALGLPSHIDAATAERFLKVKTRKIPKIVNQPGQAERLDENEIKELQARHRTTKTYIKDLKKQGKLVKEWNPSTYQAQMNEEGREIAAGGLGTNKVPASYLKRSVDYLEEGRREGRSVPLPGTAPAPAPAAAPARPHAETEFVGLEEPPAPAPAAAPARPHAGTIYGGLPTELSDLNPAAAPGGRSLSDIW